MSWLFGRILLWGTVTILLVVAIVGTVGRAFQ